jgi:transposase InsO family protein
MRLILLRSPTAREADLQRQLDLALAQLRIVQRLTAGQRLVFTDTDRRTIAEHAKAVGWKAARALLIIAALGTVRGWFRRLIAKPAVTRERKRGPGRPPITRRVRKLVARLAIENPTWGYDTIANALGNLGITISDQSVGNILAQQGIPPAGERGARRKRWRHFIAAHWRTLASCDFCSVPVISFGGLTCVNVLIVMRLATRQVHVACVHATPDDIVMAQVARNLTMVDTGFLAQHGITHLIRDNDGKYPPAFERILLTAGVESVFSPVAAPNANAHCERFIKSLQDECLDRLWFVGEKALRLTLHEYVEHFHRERNHQGIGHVLIDPGPEVKISDGGIRRRKRLGGLLSYYYREAA